LVNRKGILFHQDNARPHVSALTLRKIGELNWELLEYPPYSPDLAPSDYHLFRSLQNFLNGKNIASADKVQRELYLFFNSKTSAFFKDGIFKLVDRWEEVIRRGGDYIDDYNKSAFCEKQVFPFYIKYEKTF
ncbi:Histone-lysine N-methyltransferase SETMAR, partial [Ooceraea biroi]